MRFFDPNLVARYEVAIWRVERGRSGTFAVARAAASHAREQFRVPFLKSLFAGLRVARARRALRAPPYDLPAVWRLYDGYYRLAADCSGLLFDPAVVANLEVRYQDTHRRLAASDDKSPLLQALIELHMALFRVPEGLARGSAQWRLKALSAADVIGGDKRGDWKPVEADLHRCYRAIQALMASV